jgi:peptidoglycan/xylan/chitin deacetylase (PgdA/CDA1 family)
MFGTFIYKYKKYLKHKYYYYKFLKSENLKIEGNAIFCFHGFYNSNKGGTNSIYQTSRVELIDTIIAIEKRFKIVSLSELINVTYNRTNKLDKPLAAITIDDGFGSILKVMDIFQKFSVVPTVFICPELINRKTIPFPEIIRIALILTNEKTIDLPSGHERKVIKNFQDKILLSNIWIEYFKTIEMGNLEKELSNFISKINVSYNQIKQHELFDNLMNWDEIIALGKRIEIGSHTSNHSCLPLQTEKLAKEEIINSKQIIEEKLSVRCDMFCFPFGDSSSFSNREIDLIEEAGYEFGFILEKGFLTPESSKFAIPRWYGLQALMK